MLGAQGWGYRRVSGSVTWGTDTGFAYFKALQPHHCAQTSVNFPCPRLSARRDGGGPVSRQALLIRWLCGLTAQPQLSQLKMGTKTPSSGER